MVLNTFNLTFNYIIKTIIIKHLIEIVFALLSFVSAVYCETCVYKLADEMLRCEVCQSPHPRGFPKVCLEFSHFLEEQFAEEYARRSDAMELKEIKVKPETPSCMYTWVGYIVFDILKHTFF